MLQLIQSLFKKQVFSLSIQKQKEKKGESLDDCRRLQTNVDQSQTHTDECSRAQTSHQVSIDESQKNVDECRQLQTNHQTSVDESKNLCLIREKVTHVPILLLLQICNIRSHRQENVQFCSFICENTPHIVLSPYISKIYLPIISLNVRELEMT